ncbi:MAG: helix-turn-helix domain-containing protein, partial [Pseudomonadota bacterium]|nr:helix-turn-helix domain-containing protein [Pseudomonadota bacterium]
MNQIGNGNTSPGALLRSKREARRWSVAQVAKSMNLSRAQIAAIEADDYEALPGRTYVLGYWKNYARLLEIPFDDVIATNRENVRDPRPEMSLSNEYRDAHTEGDRSSRRAALLIGLLLVGFLAAIWYGKNVARDTERVDLSPAAGRVQEARNAGQIVREASTAFSTDEAREAPARNSGAGGANRLAETVPHPIMDQEGMTADAESLPMQPAPLQTGDASDSDGAGEPDGVARQAQAIAPEMDTAEADAAGIAT